MEIVNILTLVIGNAAVIIPLFLWNRAESRADSRMMLGMIQAIQQEMKDFHGKLERIDADFKNHLMNHMEERNKK